MSFASETGWARPDNWRLLLAVCLGQVVLITLPALWSLPYIGLLSAGLLGLCFAMFSVERTLLVLVFLNIVVPFKVLMLLRLPGGLRLQEVLLLAALGFALIDLLYRRGLALRTSHADLPVFAFLSATLLSTIVGLMHGHSLSLILRDVRYPLYYLVFFLVTNFVDRKAVLRVFLPLFVLAGLVVSIEYILEFLGAIDLSMGVRFIRVARLQGVILPLALLFIVNQLIYDTPGRYRRAVLFLGLVPIGLAFVLTVGRAMWVAFGVGLVATVWLHNLDQPATRRGVWRTALLIFTLLAFLGTTVFLFQRFTGTAITAHAVERSRTFVDYGRDIHVLGRLLSYAAAQEAIVQHPLLGNGQGATLTFPAFNPERERFEIWTTWSLDSLYLTLWFKMGLIGLAGFAWMGLRALRLSYRTFRYAQEPRIRAFAGGAVAILVAMAVLGISNGSMVNGRFALVFGVLFGLIAVVAPAAEARRQTA